MTWILDKPLTNGCSRRRPDCYCDLGSHILVIEVDESQHSGYSCENKRMCEIVKAFAVESGQPRDIPCLSDNDIQYISRPVVFIRFNPDTYKIGTTKYPGIFNRNMKLNEQELKGRVSELVETIHKYLIRPIQEITIEQLFYSDECV